MTGRWKSPQNLRQKPLWYYTNDVIVAVGLLYLLEGSVAVPQEIGLAGINAAGLSDGLPRQLAAMDACRFKIGRRAAEILGAPCGDDTFGGGERTELSTRIQVGDTLGPL